MGSRPSHDPDRRHAERDRTPAGRYCAIVRRSLDGRAQNLALCTGARNSRAKDAFVTHSHGCIPGVLAVSCKTDPPVAGEARGP